MLAHINQLKPYLQSNSDIIATIQTGFIGIWGEWFYTDYFGNNGVINSTQWLDRQDVTETLLNALPSTRTVQLRTPNFKQHFYGTTALTATEAFMNTYKSRVGHHNDCFLVDASDAGTYNNVTADKAYLAQENLYVPQGGETCGVSSYSVWSNALNDMKNLRYSYLNADYNQDVINSWGTNVNIAKRNLGYRLSLLQGTYSSTVSINGNLALNLSIKNNGFAAPYNPRKAELILRNTTSVALYRINLTTEPRRWAPNTTVTISQSVNLSGIPAGSYALLLNLADSEVSLANKPEYSIRLANSNVWEAATGFNKLNHTLIIQ